MISYTPAYELEQSRILAGVSIEDYENLPGNPDWCLPGQRSKAHLLVFWRMSQRIPAVASDAQIRKMERERKHKPR